MKLYLVRHGETDENAGNIVQGHLDTGLSHHGYDQARSIAERLSVENFDFAYSSDLTRALFTADEILSHHPLVELMPVKELREQSKGIYEGKPKELMIRDMKRQNSHWWNFTPINGESLEDVWLRVIPFYERLRQSQNGSPVLVVSHGGPIACLLSYLHHDLLENACKYVPDNTAISIIDVDKKGNCSFEIMNSSEHLCVR